MTLHHWINVLASLLILTACTKEPEVAPKVAYDGALLLSSPLGHGSGVHLGNGFVLTAGHVSEDSKGMTATTESGEKFDIDVLWYNHAFDVSLIYVEGLKDRKGAELSCAPNYVGQAITIIGNPLQTEFAQSWGRVSGLNKTGLENVDGKGLWRKLTTLDITAAPGVSGGPVYDEKTGKVVGILVAGAVSLRGTFPYSYSVSGETICHVLGRS